MVRYIGRKLVKTMYLLGLGLLVLSTWYLLKLFDNFNNDPIAKKEINQAWDEAKKEAKGKNPFAPGRIRDAIKTYKMDMAKQEIKAKEVKKESN
tara:strand:- start:843 stop:1124 length:282 start_codon:yes stop_codon:yes gene_type:complete